MNRHLHAVSPAILVLVLVAAIGSIAAQNNQAESDPFADPQPDPFGESDSDPFAAAEPVEDAGSNPFTPTKRQWLCAEFNVFSALKDAVTQKDGFVIHAFEDRTDDNTITLVAVEKKEGIDQEAVKRSLVSGRDTLEVLAESLGFDGWLIVKEEIRLNKKD
jgi:hypothetical protein